MSIVIGTKDNFTDEVINTDKVLVDFNAEWCGPCRMLGPILEELSKEVSTKIVSVNVDQEEDLATQYQVYSIPCLVLLENGKEVKRQVGLVSKDTIKKMIGE